MDTQTQKMSKDVLPNEDTKQKKVLAEVSISAVIASALAAATSLALASKIGLAGSLIGTAIAAGASTLASQVYKSLLAKSAEKIKKISDSDEDFTTRVVSAMRIHDTDSEKTEVYPALRVAQESNIPARQADAHLHEKLQEKRQQQAKKRLIIGSVILSAFAVAVVLIYSLVVNVATSGEGIQIAAPAPQTTVVEEDSKNAGQKREVSTGPKTETDSSDTSNTDKTTSTTTSDSSSTNTSNTTADSTSNNSTSTSSNSSGNTTSSTDTTGSSDQSSSSQDSNTTTTSDSAQSGTTTPTTGTTTSTTSDNSSTSTNSN